MKLIYSDYSLNSIISFSAENKLADLLRGKHIYADRKRVITDTEILLADVSDGINQPKNNENYLC